MDPFVGLYVALFLLLPAWLIWAVIFVANNPSQEILHTRPSELLGPGGPDDPFATTIRTATAALAPELESNSPNVAHQKQRRHDGEEHSRRDD
jgi:hypothetical protein